MKAPKWFIALTAASAFALSSCQDVKQDVPAKSSVTKGTVLEKNAGHIIALNENLKNVDVLLKDIPNYWALWNISKFKTAKSNLAAAKAELIKAQDLMVYLSSGEVSDALGTKLSILSKSIIELEKQIAAAEANMAAAEAPSKGVGR